MLDKTVVDATALAFGIQFTMAFPENRQLTFTTAAPQDIDDLVLRQLLKRMSDAADFLDRGYRIRALKLHIERSTVDLDNLRQQVSNIEVRNRQDFESSGRKGPYKPTGAQKAEAKNFQSTESRLVEQIKKLREEIADLEKDV
jgi:hypothetical protein